MLEFMEFIFLNFWRTIGFILCLGVLAEIPIRIVAAIASRGKSETEKTEEKEEETEE